MKADNLYCYTDESGNSGLNFFDSNQPIFYTGTLISLKNLDSINQNMCQMYNLLEVNELHANELGLHKIDRIALNLVELIKEYDFHFLFMCINKELYAKYLFSQVLFDGIVNEKISPVINNKCTRLILSKYLFTYLSSEATTIFLNAFKNNDMGQLDEVFDRLICNIRKKMLEGGVREILLKILKDIKKNNVNIFKRKLSNLDAPNVSVIDIITSALDDKYGDTIKSITFIHDEQNQFGKTTADIFESVASRNLSNNPYTYIDESKYCSLFTHGIEYRNSKDCYGLQIIDIVLWLYKRKRFENKELMNNCAELYREIDQRQDIGIFDKSYFDQKVNTYTIRAPRRKLSEQEVKLRHTYLNIE